MFDLLPSAIGLSFRTTEESLTNKFKSFGELVEGLEII